MAATYDEVFAQLTPLNLERIRIAAAHNISKERYAEKKDPVLAVEILDLEMQLWELDTKLRPLFMALKGLQTKYLVAYEGEYSLTGGKQTYWESYTEELWFKTNCQVDTNTSSHVALQSVPNFTELLVEIGQFIYHQRFTNYRILAVRTL